MAITPESFVVGLHFPGLFTPGEHGYPVGATEGELWQDTRLSAANQWGPGRTALIEELDEIGTTVLVTRGAVSFDHEKGSVKGMEAVIQSSGVWLSPVECGISSLRVVRNNTSKVIGGTVRELNSPEVRAGVKDEGFMPWLYNGLGIDPEGIEGGGRTDVRTPITRAFLFGSEGLRFTALEQGGILRPIRQMHVSSQVNDVAKKVKSLLAERLDDGEIFAAVDIAHEGSKIVPTRVAAIDPVLVDPAAYYEEGRLQAQLLAKQLIRVAGGNPLPVREAR